MSGPGPEGCPVQTAGHPFMRTIYAPGDLVTEFRGSYQLPGDPAQPTTVTAVTPAGVHTSTGRIYDLLGLSTSGPHRAIRWSPGHPARTGPWSPTKIKKARTPRP